MVSRHRASAWAAGLAWPVLAAALVAQEAPLRPLAELLEEGGTDPVETRRYATNRCAALFSLISAQRADRGDSGTADMYADWTIGFRAAALGAAMELGRTAADARLENEEATDRITTILRERMDRNMAYSRSYYTDDPLLSSDVRTCRDLVDRLRL